MAKLPLAYLTAVAATQLLMGQVMSYANCDLVKVAEGYIAERFPTLNLCGTKMVISEKGHLWELTYELPPDTLGGVPTIIIDKRACTIVRAHFTQ